MARNKTRQIQITIANELGQEVTQALQIPSGKKPAVMQAPGVGKIMIALPAVVSGSDVPKPGEIKPIKLKREGKNLIIEDDAGQALLEMRDYYDGAPHAVIESVDWVVSDNFVLPAITPESLAVTVHSEANAAPLIAAASTSMWTTGGALAAAGLAGAAGAAGGGLRGLEARQSPFQCLPKR